MTDNMARETILKEIAKLDFVLQELNLFLNTHPGHREALAMYEKYEAKSKALKKEFENVFGPLTPSVNGNTDFWEWLNGPWPWEN